MSTIKRFAEIRKVEDNDDGTVKVFGIASTEAVDAHGEIVSKAAMENALPDFFKYGTGALRSMHQPIAAGVVTKASINDSGETEIEATVVDPVEVAKVKAGVYKGFSIGGSKVPGGYDTLTKTITAMKLTEISLVDRPANPEATISMWKSEDIVASVPAEAAAAVDALAEILNKGDVSPARLVELAQAEIEKGKAPPFAAKDDDEAAEDGTDEDGKKKKAKKDDTEKSEGAGEIKKGMYSVSDFAGVLRSIGYLVGDLQCEADWEGDNSPVPEKMRQWLTAGAALFQELAAEEIAEFVAQYAPPAAAVVVAVELSEQAATLRKALDAAASVSLVDYLSIAKAHMPENDIAKAVLADGFEKATDAVLARLEPEHEAIAKLADATASIAKLEGERDELIAKVAALSAQPAASNAVLRVVVEKGVDVAQTNPPVQAGPVLKADGSVDSEATALAAIKKVHQSGGHSLRSFNPT